MWTVINFEIEYVRLLLLLTCFTLTSTASAQLCPPCYRDQNPLPGQGVAPDGHRRTLYIKVDPDTWGSPVPSNIAQGAQKAADLWNGVQTCYYFTVITTGTPDFLVTSSTAPNGGCADDNINTYSYTIHLLNSLQASTYSSDRIGSLLAHEIGHGIGLDNADEGCPDGASIMEGYIGTGCQPVTSGPTLADVTKANQNCSPDNRSSCERTKPSDPADPETWSCYDDNGCSGYDQNGYAISNPDQCEYPDSEGYVDGCPNGWYYAPGGGDPGMFCC
jgi:hypothetical protein